MKIIITFMFAFLCTLNAEEIPRKFVKPTPSQGALASWIFIIEFDEEQVTERLLIPTAPEEYKAPLGEAANIETVSKITEIEKNDHSIILKYSYHGKDYLLIATKDFALRGSVGGEFETLIAFEGENVEQALKIFQIAGELDRSLINLYENSDID